MPPKPPPPPPPPPPKKLTARHPRDNGSGLLPLSGATFQLNLPPTRPVPRPSKRSLAAVQEVIAALESSPIPLRDIPWSNTTMNKVLDAMRRGETQIHINVFVPAAARNMLVSKIADGILKHGNELIPYQVLPDGRYVLSPTAVRANLVMDHLIRAWKLHRRDVRHVASGRVVQLLAADPGSPAGRTEAVAALRGALTRDLKAIDAGLAAIVDDVKRAVRTLAPVVENRFKSEPGKRSFKNHWRSLNLDAVFKGWKPTRDYANLVAKYIIVPISKAERFYRSTHPNELQILKTFQDERVALDKLRDGHTTTERKTVHGKWVERKVHHQGYIGMQQALEKAVREMDAAGLMYPTLLEAGVQPGFAVVQRGKLVGGAVIDAVQTYVAAANELIAKKKTANVKNINTGSVARNKAAREAAARNKAAREAALRREATEAATRNKAARNKAAAAKAAAIRREEAAAWEEYAARQDAKAARNKAARNQAALEKEVGAWVAQFSREATERDTAAARQSHAQKRHARGLHKWWKGQGQGNAPSGSTRGTTRTPGWSVLASSNGDREVRGGRTGTPKNSNNNKKFIGTGPRSGWSNGGGTMPLRLAGSASKNAGTPPLRGYGASAWTLPAVLAAGAAGWWKGRGKKAAATEAGAQRRRGGRLEAPKLFNRSTTRTGRPYKPATLNT